MLFALFPVIALCAFGAIVLTILRMQGPVRLPTSGLLMQGTFLALAGVTLVVSGPEEGLPEISGALLFLAGAAWLACVLGFHLWKNPVPIPLLFSHAALAVASYVALFMTFLLRLFPIFRAGQPPA